MIDLLDFPFWYNLRFLVAGKQRLTREFIANNYRKFNCHTVVDIGCGSGDFSPLFPKGKYLGIDRNPRYIAFAQKTYPHRFICADILDFPFNQQSFDAAIVISTLHHLSDTEVQRLFSRIAPLTKKVIIIVDLNPETTVIKRLLIRLDRGKFVRSTQAKINLLSPFGTIVTITHFSTNLASQTGMVVVPFL